MKTQKLHFRNKDGEELSARLEWPVDKKPRAFALLAHCFTCSKDLKGLGNLSRGLTAEGIAVLRFDFTGLGESEGDFSETHLSSNVDDLVKAGEHLEAHYGPPALLVGHSLGGAAVLMAASRIDNVEAVATVGAPADPEHVTAHFQDDLDTIEREGGAQVKIGGRPFTIKKEFVDDLSSHHPESQLAELRKPVLVMHSPQDRIVGVDNARRIYQAAHHPKSFISLDGADHLLSKQEDSVYAGKMIAAWVTKYLASVPDEWNTEHQVAARTTDQSLTTEIAAGKHRLLADEPEKAGGNDMGPDPYRLLMASLGSCTSLTLHVYAKRKEWDLKEARVHLSHDQVYAEDREDVGAEKGKLDRFTRSIEMEGDLDEDQRKRLLEIADKCPVHRSLHSEIVVDTRQYEQEEG
ncbi:MAG: alpha/beta fold hydrolase [Flavobacteriales bacterium]